VTNVTVDKGFVVPSVVFRSDPPWLVYDGVGTLITNALYDPTWDPQAGVLTASAASSTSIGAAVRNLGIDFKFYLTNVPPVALSQSVATLVNVSCPITLDGIDVRGPYTVITQPAHGTLAGTAPNLIYTPVADYGGPDSFTFKVSNGVFESVASVSITVNKYRAIWTNSVAGLNWSAAANWTNNMVADGSDTIAYFDAIDLASDMIVHLDTPRTIGNLVFGDTITNSVGGWTLDNHNSPTNVLTLGGPAPSIMVNALGGAKNATVSAVIAGTAGLVKEGVGTLTLCASNTYSGPTIVNAGTLVVQTNGALGSVTNGVTINDGATLSCNGVMNISCPISGSGSLTKAGTSTVTLTANNSYLGSTIISAGVMKIQNPYALGDVAGNTLVSNGARLELQGGIAVNSEMIRIAGNGGNFFGAIQSSINGASATNIWAGNITVAEAGTRIGAQANATLVVAGVIDSGGTNLGVTFRPADTTASVIVSGANTYVGDTAIVGGRLQLDGEDNRLPKGTKLNFGLSTVSGSFDLNGHNQEVSGLSVISGTANYITNSAAVAGVLTVNTPAGSPSANSAPIQGNIAIVKSGSDQLTLSGIHPYTGSTTVSNGALLVNGTIGASPVTVKSGAILGGTGVMGGAVTLNAGGVLSPGGTNIGTLTFNGDLVVSGNLLIEIKKSQAQSNDLAVVAGSLSNTGTGTLTVSNLGAGLAAGDRFTLFNKPLSNGKALTVTGGGVNWTNNLAVDGSIAVLSILSTVATNPTNIVFSVTSSNFSLSWPADHLGWYLQAQTNSLSAGFGTNWANVPNSSTVTNVVVPLVPTNPAVFYRMSLQP
jgi:autotransporter-associated beta strand protein